MARYCIRLMDKAGALQEERLRDFESDDDAIDCAGAVDHPYAIEVWQAQRHVAAFPPVGALRSLYGGAAHG
ncbi:hypothetical protein ACO2Q3_25300 [Caulobacter sp. KR2-114]|uniref:hypothetical protein n=1 Tax=Caulobacter sp. KR2-114 TaxID=3400912 RepID=UPI003C0B1117